MFFVFFPLKLGAIEASKESIGWTLSNEGTGNSLTIMIGGAQEALEAKPGCKKLKIMSRKGFCKLALQHG